MSAIHCGIYLCICIRNHLIKFYLQAMHQNNANKIRTRVSAEVVHRYHHFGHTIFVLLSVYKKYVSRCINLFSIKETFLFQCEFDGLYFALPQFSAKFHK